MDDYVLVAAANLPVSNQDRTLEMWIYANSFPSTSEEAFFAGYGAFGSYNQTYHLGSTGNNLFFSQWGSGISGPALTANVWHHVAVTNIGNDAILYLDGMEVGRKTVIDTPANSEFCIGKIPGSTGDIRKLNGKVDEVAVYQGALSADDIQALYLNGLQARPKPTAGIKITPSSVLATGLATDPASVAHFTVTLEGTPASNVSISIPVRVSDSSEGLVSSDGTNFSPSVTLTLGPSQMSADVWVQGQNDSDQDRRIHHHHSTPPIATDPSSPYPRDECGRCPEPPMSFQQRRIPVRIRPQGSDRNDQVNVDDFR